MTNFSVGVASVTKTSGDSFSEVFFFFLLRPPPKQPTEAVGTETTLGAPSRDTAAQTNKHDERRLTPDVVELRVRVCGVTCVNGRAKKKRKETQKQ